jgi:hypothetical protein
MNLQEIDAALAALPASPVTDADLLARANLMRRRGELIGAALTESARPRVHPGNLVVSVPEGISCVYTMSGITRVTETVDGRQIIRMTTAEFRNLLSGGTMGQQWALANPEIMRQLAAADMAASQFGMR